MASDSATAAERIHQDHVSKWDRSEKMHGADALEEYRAIKSDDDGFVQDMVCEYVIEQFKALTASILRGESDAMQQRWLERIRLKINDESSRMSEESPIYRAAVWRRALRSAT